jgi:hypothetical protein
MTKKFNIVLNRMNQDCCEFHFSHVHGACGNAMHLAQLNANACALTSQFKSSIKASTNGNVTVVKKQQTI